MSVYITKRRWVRDAPANYVETFFPATIAFHANGSLLISDLQAARALALQHAYRKAELAHPREDAPKVGQMRNLGLLDKEDDSRAVLAINNKTP